MNFRNQVTFNSHDSTFKRVDGRLTIQNGVRQRCELVLNVLAKFGKDGAKLQEIVNAANTRLNKDCYSVMDIKTILGRLRESKLVIAKLHKSGYYVYRPIASALKLLNR